MNIRLLFFIFTMTFLWHSQAVAKDVSWDKAGSQKITMFYPGATSWEFLNSEDHGLGGKNMKKGKKNCADCHMSKDSGLDLKVDDIIAGKLKMKKSQKPFEPEPLSGKRGLFDLNMQAAYDEEYVYIRLQWQSSGSSWNNPKLADDGLPDRVSIQLSRPAGKEEFLSKYGCFRTCHNDLNSMPESPSKKQVRKNQYYGAIKRDDVRLYAFYTRNDGWAAIKADNELKAILKDSGLIDVWEVGVKGKEVMTEDGWIVEDRRKDDKEDIKADANWENGKYTITIKRKLQTGDPTDIQIKEGDALIFGIAVYDDKMSRRKHYVAFPFTVGLGTNGDVKAEKLK